MAHAHTKTLLSKLGFADADRKNPKHDIACQYLTLPEQVVSIGKLVHRASLESPALVVEPFDFAAKLLELDWRCVNGVVRPGPDGSPLGAEDEAYLALHHKTVALAMERESVTSAQRIEMPTEPEWQPRTEVIVTKGFGQYSSTIGFLDVVQYHEVVCVGWKVSTQTVRSTGPDGRPNWAASRTTASVAPAESRSMRNVVIEVKATPSATPDAIRQIAVYREHSGSSRDRIFWVLATTYDITKDDARVLAAERITHVRLGAKFDAYLAARQSDTSVAESEEI